MLNGRDRARALTLTELPVIIAILAAILLPVLAQARAKGRQAACLNNVNQGAIATLAHAQDYDESLPFAVGGNAGGPRFRTTAELPYPYVRNTQIRSRPSDPTGALSVSMLPGLGRHSHAWNKAIFAYRLPSPGPIMSRSDIPLPPETTRFSDGYPVGMAQHTYYRHQGGARVSFLDGHGKWHPENVPPPSARARTTTSCRSNCDAGGAPGE